MGPERPFWVGLVCWVLILTGMYGIYSTMKVLNTDAFEKALAILPYSTAVAKMILFGTLAAMVVAGICMYERVAWARWLYLLALPPFFFQRFLAITTPPPLPAIDPADAQDPLYIQSHLPPTPNHTKEEFLLAVFVVLYLLSLWILFTLRARRYFHPPMYVDE